MMKRLFLLSLLLGSMYLLQSQSLPRAQYFSLDSLAYSGMDVAVVNDSTAYLLGQVNDWDSTWTGFWIEGSFTLGIQISRYRLDQGTVESTRFFPAGLDYGFVPAERLVLLAGGRLGITYGVYTGTRECEETPTIGNFSDGLGFLILDQDLNVVSDSFSQYPYCQRFSQLHSFAHPGGELFTTVVKNEISDSMQFITLDHEGKLQTVNTYHYPRPVGAQGRNTHWAVDEQGVLMVHPPELRRYSFTGVERYRVDSLTLVPDPRAMLSLSDGSYALAGQGLMRLDSLGNALWQTSFPEPLTHLAQLPQSQDLVAVYRNMDPGPNRRNLGFSRYSLDGDRFQTDFYGDTAEIPTALRAYGDDRLMLTGAHLILPYERSPDPGTFYLLETTAPDRVLSLNHPAQASLMLYPNPAQEQLNLRYTLEVPTEVRISVHDLTGRELRELQPMGAMPAGEHEVVFSVGDLPTGVYLIQVSWGGHRQWRKWIKE